MDCSAGSAPPAAKACRQRRRVISAPAWRLFFHLPLQLGEEILGVSPEDADVRVGKIGFQIMPGSRRIDELFLFRINLDRNVGEPLPPVSSFLAHDAAKEDAKIPVGEL